MLVLTRKLDAKTVLLTPGGERIEVWVHRLSDDGKKVRICFDAPDSVEIHRAELEWEGRAKPQ